MMQMTVAGRQALTERTEGLRLVAYRDCVGVLTIGYGHTNAAGLPLVTPGLRWTQEQADAVLAQDMLAVENGLARLLRRQPTDRQFDALADLTFNIGLGAFRSSTLLRKFNAGDLMGAAQAFLAWNRAGGRVVGGLTRRRQLEKDWFLGGEYQVSLGLFDDLIDMPHGLHDLPNGPLERAWNRACLVW